MNADVPAPARNYEEAALRFGLLAARDGAAISSAGRSRLFGHGRRTPRAVVLLHGFTNCPEQWVIFAKMLWAAGDTVVIPRLPGHGYFDRATRAAARPSGAAVLAIISDAIDIACGAGETVALIGLSIGGTLGPRVALDRADVAQTIALVPFFAIKNFDASATRRLAAVLTAVPNVSMPWDPFGDGSAIPSYGYPKFSTKMLGRFLRIGDEVNAIARDRAPAGRTTFVLNASEPACENAVTKEVAAKFERAQPNSTRLVVWSDLPANHDIIDPTNPKQRIDLVYPRLRQLLDA